MQFTNAMLIALSFAILSPLISATPSFLPKSSSLVPRGEIPFMFTELFTANLTLGSAQKPITTPSGETVVEPIAGGYLTGPSINATVHSGIAHPTIMKSDNLTFHNPLVQLWGATTDNQTFFVHLEGVGSPNPQVARATIEIAGTTYAQLRDNFVLVTILEAANGLSTEVMAYTVVSTLTN